MVTTGRVLTDISKVRARVTCASKAGNVFIWKPMAMTADERIQFCWGGPVLVTENGAERLFKRAHGMVSVA